MISEDVRESLDLRFDHHAPSDPRVAESHGVVRNECKHLAIIVAQLCPEGREKALALTKIEEAMMFANAAIARNQVDALGRYTGMPRVPLDA
jgi:hypothetical protein